MAELNTYRGWLEEAKKLNPDVPEQQLISYWLENYSRAPAQPEKPGFLSDTGASLKAGVYGLAASAREIGRRIFGDTIGDLFDKFDESVGFVPPGPEPYETRLAQKMQEIEGSMTPETQEARRKDWWNEEEGTFGSAWTDPRAYWSALMESVPGTLATMGPSGLLARKVAQTAFERAIARGATEEAAKVAAGRTAASTAYAAGGALEGLQQAGASGMQVRQAIERMDESVLADSDAYQALLASGLTPEEARKQLARDASAQAMLMAGTITAAFGGAGDRMLVKAIGREIGGNTLERIAKGMASEGLLEEFPQGYGSKVAENLALRQADKTVEPTAGALGEALGGAVVGGIMGGAMAAPFAKQTEIESSAQRVLDDLGRANTVEEMNAAAVRWTQEQAAAIANALSGKIGLPIQPTDVFPTEEAGRQAQLEAKARGEDVGFIPFVAEPPAGVTGEPQTGVFLARNIPLTEISRVEQEQGRAPSPSLPVASESGVRTLDQAGNRLRAELAKEGFAAMPVNKAREAENIAALQETLRADAGVYLRNAKRLADSGQVEEAAKMTGIGSAIAQTVVTPAPDSAVPGAPFIRAMANAFGSEVQFFYSNREKTPNGFVIERNNRRVLYINARSQRAHMQVAGHELAHYLEREHPDLYAAAKEKIVPLFRELAKEEIAKRYEGRGLNESELNDELLSDLFGIELGNKPLWRELKKREPNLFRDLARRILEFLDTLLSAIKAGNVRALGVGESRKIVSDIEAARKVIADTLAEVAVRTSEGRARARENASVELTRDTASEKVATVPEKGTTVPTKGTEDRVEDEVGEMPQQDAQDEERPKKEPEKRKATREDFTKEGIKNILNLDGWAIVTAENPGGSPPSENPEEADRINEGRTRELRDYLEQNKIDYIEIRGKYATPESPEERSFVIFTDRQRAFSIGERFGQDSILTNRGLEYMSGDITKTDGSVDVYEKRPENFYSRLLGEGWAFKVGLNFDEDSGAKASLEDENVVNDHGFSWTEAEEKIGMKIPVPLRLVSAARRLYFGGFELRGQKQGETGRMKVTEVAGLVYRRATRAFRGKAKREFTDENLEFIAKVLAADALLELKLNPDRNGSQWYRETMERAISEASKLYPEIAEADGRLMFTLALAITSNGMSIGDNVVAAFQQYEHFRKTGVFPVMFTFGGERNSTMRKQFAMANELLRRFSGNEVALREYIFTKVPAKDVMVEFGIVDEDGVLTKKSLPEKVDELVYRSSAFGPKVGGAFWPSLNGIGDVVTMDRWFMRTWGRITGTGLKTNEDGSLALNKAGEAQMVDAPTGGGQRSFIRKTMARAVEIINEQGYDIRPTDLQALLWYVEKRYYQSFGATDARGSPTDYDVHVREYVKRRLRNQGSRDGGTGPRRGVVAKPAPAEQPSLFASVSEPDEAASRSGRVGAVRIVGIHYSTEPRLALRGGAYGLGIKGAEATRVMSASDHRIKNRVYFYIRGLKEQPLPRPEGGVGSHVHEAVLGNLYDPSADEAGIWARFRDVRDPAERANLRETAIIDAGYDGYVSPSVGVAVVLNKSGIPVKYLGEAKDLNISKTFYEPKGVIEPDTEAPSNLASLDEDDEYTDVLMPDVEGDALAFIEQATMPEETAESIRRGIEELRSTYKPTTYDVARLGREWLDIARNNRELFTFPFSEAKELTQVAKEMSGGRVAVKTRKPDKIELSIASQPDVIENVKAMGLSRFKIVKTHELILSLTKKQAEDFGRKYASAFVYETDGGHAILNVSLFESGVTQGNLIYQIVGTWAHNSGRKFIGDPVGLSERAIVRRTENMFVNALRTGSTRHLLPHPYQRMAGLSWLPNDDEYNIGAMAMWGHDVMERFAPAQFALASGSLTGERPKQLSRPAFKSAPRELTKIAEAGPRTSARVAITEALMRARAENGPEVLKELGTTLDGRINGEILKGQILYSLDISMEDVRGAVHDLFRRDGSVSVWDKTVSTQYAKAQKWPEFARVYNAAQKFLSDTSLFANAATDYAPSILPKMEHWTDAIRGARADIFGGRAKDIEVASKALFDGTIEDRVWTDDELRARGMNSTQIGMYRQMRRAINTSLDQLAVSEIYRLTRNMGLDEARQQIIGMPADRAREFMLDAIAKLPVFNEKQQEALEFVRSEINKKANRIEGLKATGYAPLMRFGRYALEFSQDGERHFMLFETEFARNRFLRELRKEPGVTDVTTGTMSSRTFELFRGFDPNALELFGETATLEYMDDEGNLQSVRVEEDQMFQQYLKLAIASRSALKRLIKRKKVAGYSEDGARVLAQFIVSNARMASRNINLPEMLSAAAKIDKTKGDLRDEAIGLVKYLQDPKEEAAGLRGFLFFNFLGGSVASALVNMTQPVMMTFPYLSRWGAAEAMAALTRGFKQAVSRKRPAGKLGEDLLLAEEQGIVSPQEIHSLFAEANRSLTGDIRVRRALTLWGSLFSAAEQFNRRATFVAAWEIGNKMGIERLKAEGFSSPYEFAVHAVAETQGTYNKGNRPNWTRGPAGAVIFTFKQYSIHYLEWWMRLPRSQKVLAMAMLVAASGIQGLPFADDLDDLIDSMAQALGYAWNTRDKKREFLASAIGKTAADIVLSGFSSVPGVPLDVQGRMSMGNLIPGTGLLKRSNVSPMRDTFEVLGPAGGLASSIIEGSKEVMAGNVAAGAVLMAPIAVRNILKGADIIQTGAYRDVKGKKIIDADLSDAIVKIIGFQPADVARVTRVERSVQEMVSLARSVQQDIAEKWAEGIYLGKPELVQAAKEELSRWNSDNPDFALRVRMQDVFKRVKAKRETRSERIERTAPKAIRREIGERLRAE